MVPHPIENQVYRFGATKVMVLGVTEASVFWREPAKQKIRQTPRAYFEQNTTMLESWEYPAEGPQP